MQRQEASGTPESDTDDSISILIALARPCVDKRRHQLLLWFVDRLRERPLEVSRGAQLLSGPFRQVSQESVAAIP